MKIEKVSEKSFKPIQITITIESENELSMLKHMCRWDVSIPKLLIDSEKLACFNFLRNLADKL